MDQVMHLNGSGLPSPALILIIPPTNQILTPLSLLRSLFSKKNPRPPWPELQISPRSLRATMSRHTPMAEAWQLMGFLYPKLLNHLA